MSNDTFTIKIHKFPGQHIRQYPGATRIREEDVLYLEAKQYIPLSNTRPRTGDITILATHAVSFPKELYEPLWIELLRQCQRNNLRIRSIWVADASNQGASGVLNELTQGDDPSFFDYPRDLLHMVNLFRQEFPQPIVGIGHSMGGTSLIQLAALHPRLMASLVLFDPVVGVTVPTDFASLFYLNSVRPDLWPLRTAAEQASRSLFRSWDSRVLALWMEYGLRSTPTLLHEEPGKTTLSTSKAQEAWIYGRSWFDPLPVDGSYYATPETQVKYPDMHDGMLQTHPFYRPEDVYVWQDLPRLRPGVLYICPDKGPMTDANAMKAKLERTGSGVGGSGGVNAGRVSSAIVTGVGHLLPFENPSECATVAADWLGRDVAAWKARGIWEKEHRDDKSVNQIALSPEWIRQAKLFLEKSKRNGRSKL